MRKIQDVAKILIIDDDSAVRSLMQKVLERRGHEVRVAVDGHMGIDLHRTDPADLIITDLIMPGKEGIETIQGRGYKIMDPATDA